MDAPIEANSHAALSTLIEGEIIPQLLAAHGVPRSPADIARSARISAEDVRRFVPLALVLEADELLEHVEGLLARGIAAESIFVDLLAPAARKLGEFWESDTCDFVDVTIGLWRLQEVMREIAWRTPAISGSLFSARTALFSPIPGDQHSFGTLMVEEIFSRGGWQSELLIEPQRRDLLTMVGGRHFDLIGLTVSRDCHSGELSDLITAVRSVSLNPKLYVMLGGRAINDDPGLADLAGADGTAPDGPTALALAERLVVKAEPRTALAC
ncbi:B12-binding domain-containing protein [Novosphingobium sp. Gsoil 351]|uniref:cobalamin B12-binding domain-containing protein n=1 Tax=Novosphingobium sp. Gsoil 351 TaxID=2675225 RepID=UPI0012B45763|nr:B12-binding domain-containing protein [Novosphingobium sp. Gsoil 351]QGN54590.1 cobalamin B12-binding protein [Novosphingobium sp. Gsoil 351]